MGERKKETIGLPKKNSICGGEDAGITLYGRKKRPYSLHRKGYSLPKGKRGYLFGVKEEKIQSQGGVTPEGILETAILPRHARKKMTLSRYPGCFHQHGGGGRPMPTEKTRGRGRKSSTNLISRKGGKSTCQRRHATPPRGKLLA